MNVNRDSLQQTQMDTTLTTKNDVSKWFSPNPLSDKHPEISPYAYCNWNPVKYIFSFYSCVYDLLFLSL